MKTSTLTELKTMSGEQLLVCRLCAAPDLWVAIERELDRRSVVARVTEILARRPSSAVQKRRRVA